MDKAKLDSCVEKSGFLAPPAKADADDPPLVQRGTPERGVKIPPPSDPSLRKIWESGVAERAAQGKGRFVGDACSKLDAAVELSGKIGEHWTALQPEEDVWSVNAPVIGKKIRTATGHMAKVISVRPDTRVGFISHVRYDRDDENSPAYDAALVKFNAASSKFREAQRAYRAMQIGDAAYMAARTLFEEAKKEMDRATPAGH